jgi:hypothetical protein
MPAGNQIKILVRDHDVQEAGHPADRAIAIECRHGRIRQLRRKAHGTAMTASGEMDHG